MQPRSHILSSVLFPYYFSRDIHTPNSRREKTSPLAFGLPPYNCFASTGSATSLRNDILDSIGRPMLNVHSTDYRTASEGWGRYCFHTCLSVHTWGGGGGYPFTGSFPGHWSQVLSGRYPSRRFSPRSFLGGTPVLVGRGGNMNRFSPAPSRSGWGLGTPRPVQDAIPPVQVRMGVPPPPPQGQNSRASICYAACGMPPWVHAGGLSSITVHFLWSNIPARIKIIDLCQLVKTSWTSAVNFFCI